MFRINYKCTIWYEFIFFMKKSSKIAVIGGGPMGLAVAYELTLQGYKPVIFEADNRLGGMASCFDFEG